MLCCLTINDNAVKLNFNSRTVWTLGWFDYNKSQEGEATL